MSQRCRERTPHVNVNQAEDAAVCNVTCNNGPQNGDKTVINFALATYCPECLALDVNSY